MNEWLESCSGSFLIGVVEECLLECEGGFDGDVGGEQGTLGEGCCEA